MSKKLLKPLKTVACVSIGDRQRQNDIGFALVLVIGALGVLALAALTYTKLAQSYMRSVSSAIETARAEMLADAGAQLAMLELTAAKLNPDRKPSFAFDGTPSYCVFETGGRLRLSVEDVAGKVDLNAATDRLLSALFRAIGATTDEASGYARAIVRFRAGGTDSDEGDTRFFHVVEELGQIPGIPGGAAQKLQRLITVHSGLSGIDPSVASIDLLLAILNIEWSMEPASWQQRNEAAVRDIERFPREFAVPSPRRAFVIRAQARTTNGSIFVRETTVEFQNPPGLPILRTWRRSNFADADPDDLAQQGAPC